MQEGTQHRNPAPARPVFRRGIVIVALGLCVVANVAIWSLLTGSFDDTSVRVLLSASIALLCTLGGLAGATALRIEGAGRRLGVATIAVSALTLLVALVLVWIPNAPESDALLRTVGVTSVLTLAGAHASLLVARLRAGDTGAVRRLAGVAIACAISAALLLSGLFAAAEGPVAPAVWRLLGVLIILAVLNTLLVPLARKIRRERSDAGGFDALPGARV